MILEHVRPFRSRTLSYGLAVERWELAAYHALRRGVFCDEQRLFQGDDRDGEDARRDR